MNKGLLDQVRVTCKKVVERSAHVKINEQEINSYVKSLPLEELETPRIDSVHHYYASPGETIVYILTLDTVNFGSGYFPHLIKRPGKSGYFTIASALKDRFSARGPFSAQELSFLCIEDCADIFGQDLGDSSRRELMGLYAEALNSIGDYITDSFDGEFVKLVEAAGSSAGRLVGILSEMQFFRDVDIYNGLEVMFYKRAQITAADIYSALNGQGLGFFYDIDRLTAFADNVVPHVLRIDGILQYEDRLLSRIENEILIPAGSAEEVEIRASAVHAVELIVDELRNLGHHVRAMDVDYLLWSRGQLPEYKRHPRHRTRTVFY